MIATINKSGNSDTFKKGKRVGKIPFISRADFDDYFSSENEFSDSLNDILRKYLKSVVKKILPTEGVKENS